MNEYRNEALKKLQDSGAEPFDLPTAPRYRLAAADRFGEDVRLRLVRR